MVCEECKEKEAVYKCPICDLLVCQDCYDLLEGVCQECCPPLLKINLEWLEE